MPIWPWNAFSRPSGVPPSSELGAPLPSSARRQPASFLASALLHVVVVAGAVLGAILWPEPLPEQGEFGASSVAPTLYSTDNPSANVIPSEIHLVLDYRNVPADRPEAARARMADLLAASLEAEATADIVIPQRTYTTWTGVEWQLPAIFPAFETPADSPLVDAAQAALSEALGEDTPVILWRFATDGGHTAAAGVPTLGFGPGDDRLAHTANEQVRVADVLLAAEGYAQIALEVLGKR